MFSGALEKYRIAYIGKGNQETTAVAVCKELERILYQLNRNYGVRIEEGRFVGLTSPVLMDWYNDMTKLGRKMTTKNCYVSLLNPFLKWAVKYQMIPKKRDSSDPDELPIYEVLETNRLPKEDSIPDDQKKQKAYTGEQLLSIMDAIEEVGGTHRERNKAILALLMYSALRVSELCSLTVSSVLEQPHGTIYVKRKGGVWKYTPVHESFYPYLYAYLDKRGPVKGEEKLFTSQKGGGVTRSQVWRILSKYEELQGFTTGCHIIRHTVISNIDKNYGAGAARDIANHSSLAITNRYTHTTAQERSEAINSLDW